MILEDKKSDFNEQQRLLSYVKVYDHNLKPFRPNIYRNPDRPEDYLFTFQTEKRKGMWLSNAEHMRITTWICSCLLLLYDPIKDFISSIKN